MNASLISVNSIQKVLAILAILALVFGPFSKVFTAQAVTLDSVCSVEVVSADGDDNAVATYVHPAWTSIPDATWIWSDATVIDTTVDQTEVFTKSFNWNGDVTTANLQIAADNGYSVSVNGTLVGSSPTSVSNYASPTSYDVSSLLVTGVNTLSFEVTNLGTPDVTDPHSNPAGLLYRLDVTGTNPHCMTLPSNTITVVKNFDGEAPSEWSFDFNSSFGPFTLTNGNDSTTTKLLDGGSYNISESLDTNVWDTPSISCSDETLGENGAVTVDLGLEQNVTCTVTNHQKKVETPAPVCIGDNLLQNASFEDPLIQSTDIGAGSYAGGYYEDFTSIPNWTSSSADGFEVWNNMFGGASDPAQNLELDVKHPTNVSQTVTTVVGNKYKVSYDFAARPGTGSSDNVLNLAIDGQNVGDSVTADGGSADSSSVWSSHYYEFTAATTSTKIEFQDAGTDDGSGTLLDNTAVCLTQDNQETPVQTYHIFGFAWDDVNQNNATDTDESNLAGLTVHITNGDTTLSTTTAQDGSYYFDVPAGTWTITEVQGEDWTVTSPDTDSYTVCVPDVCPSQDAEAPHQSIFASIMNAMIPTAYAMAIQPTFGPYNFGNKAVVHGTGTPSRPTGGGAYISLSGGTGNTTNNGQVLGASTSTDPSTVVPVAVPVVIPVGAPNTGAGGTSALVINLPSHNAYMFERRKLRSIKNG